MSETSLLERYERAANATPAKFRSRLSGALGDGYWVDDRHYFYSVTGPVGEGVMGALPHVVDASSGVAAPVLGAEAIVALLSGSSEAQVTPTQLAGAQYDMPARGSLIVTLAGSAYHIALDGPTLSHVEAVDPIPSLYSPDGGKACFLKDHAVWIKDRATGVAAPLTPEGEPLYSFGAEAESAIMPLTVRKVAIPRGLWSRNSAWFVTHRIDERHLPESGLVESAPAGGKRAVVHVFKVSAPDGELATFELLAFHPASGRFVSSAERPAKLPLMSPFSFRHSWFAGEAVYYLDWDRYASQVDLVEMNLETGVLRTVVTETAENHWIDLHPMVSGQPMVRTLPQSGEVIWPSQRDGSNHLYLYDLASGALKNQITRGEWTVREIVHVDETKRRILFLASGFEGQADLGHRRLCAIGFDGAAFETVLALDADVAAAPDPTAGSDQMKPFRPSYAPTGASADGRYVIAALGGADQATRFVLIETATGTVTELSRIDVDDHWTAPRPQPFEVLAADDVTLLHGVMCFPSDFDPTKRYPLVDYIYPGPQANWFMRRFPNMNLLSLQSVAELGVIGIILETRGMPGRGRAFHQAGRGALHEPQLSDHVAAIEQLNQRHAFIDRARVGIFGQSGGGYATARALFDYPEVFKVGVSVCGNHDNRNYIAHWIDKYGGRPGTPERDSQSNVEVAHKLEGKLLLIHGDMDDNVHPGHTLALSRALISAGKDFDQLIVPGATHGVLFESAYANQRLWNFFVRHLIGSEPPEDFVLQWTPAEMAGALMNAVADMS